ncbi:hypothetical protein EV361DRAFT_1036637 [Lentinula raphanica]|uniref:Uncharacterized protein n=1 Tax=Lentinula raphanica TaxID=153919 RepID=A0AA38PAV5_9AGAR|nr:hypothetical protein F5880DRAFT_1508321 [Lentinula raphanica]KAJ3839508.1 hypothetical protein F5878DRAFT_616234 [Lentinula raphanica]KAJ3966873.1 hypothetical protein EV361DRAFT_1036637 [Lentinula raphanica]
MSPDEQELLVSSAEVAFFGIVSLIVTITGYGAFVLGTTIAILFLLRRYSLRHTLASRGLLACLIVIFICSTWNACYVGAFSLTIFRFAFVRTLPEGLVTQVQSASNHNATWRYVAASWIPTIITLLGDCIVVWRAWILFQQEKFLGLSLMTLMIANIGINVTDCILSDIKLQVEIAQRLTTLDWLSSALSLAVNLYATILIALKAWHHYRFMKNALLHEKTRAQHILLLLVESGAMYCAIQTVYEVLLLLETYTAVGTSFTLTIESIISVYFVLAASYPVAVMILVYKDISPIVEIFNQTKDNLQTMQLSHSDAHAVLEQGRHRDTE